jgi:hypothetical protein
MPYQVGHYFNQTVDKLFLDPNARFWLGTSGGAVTSLTTTGTTGAATLVSGVLNIPTYTSNFVSLTTTGTSGAATLSGGVLNVPQYAGAVASVSAANASLTITPTTGAAAANINLANSNTYSVTQGVTYTTAAAVSGLDINITTSTSSGDVCIARFFGQNQAGGTRNSFIKLGNTLGGSYLDLNNDGGGILSVRYGNSQTALGGAVPIQIVQDGRVTIATSLCIGNANLPTNTFLGLTASTTSKSNANFPVGVAVTSPNAGDMYNDAVGNLNFKGGLSITGGHLNAITLQAAGYAILATDYTVIATGTTATWTFPTAVTGRILVLVNHGSGSLTIPSITTGNGTTSTTLTAGSRATIQYDGTVWRQIGA